MEGYHGGGVPDLLRFIYPDADDVYNLDMSSNPFAQVIVAAKMRLQEGKISEDELLNNKLLAARKLTEKGFGMEKDPSHL